MKKRLTNPNTKWKPPRTEALFKDTGRLKDHSNKLALRRAKPPNTKARIIRISILERMAWSKESRASKTAPM